MSKVISLKCWPEYFREVKSGKKTFEFRRDDRAFEVGDSLVLLEFDPELQEYTREAVAVRVTYIARGSLIPEGFCVMSIEPVEDATDRARRIRELVREWVGKPAYFEENLIVFKTEFLPELFAQAVEIIDAIDDAEIPAKEPR